MMKSLLIVAATTTVASADTIDLFATSSWENNSDSYLMQSGGYWNPFGGGQWMGGPHYVSVNGGFESVVAGDGALPAGANPGDTIDGWVGWNLYGGQAWQADDANEGDGLFGSAAAKVWAGNPGDYAGAAIDIDVSKLNAGDILTFSVDIYTPENDGVGRGLGEAYAEINGFDADGNLYADTNSRDARPNWSDTAGIQTLGGNLFSYTVAGDESRIEVNVGFAGNGNWGAMFIDNMSLTLVPAPGALALLGFAAVGRRRRK